MRVAYGPPTPGFEPAEELPHPEMTGYVCLRKPNGMYVSFLSDGTFGEQPHALGGEAFLVKGNYYAAAAYPAMGVLPRAVME